MNIRHEDSVAANVKLQVYTKGLSSSVLSDRMSTISGTSSLIKTNPFPLFVNNIVIHLTTAFSDKNSSNLIRLIISRVLSECPNELTLVFSHQKAIDNVLVVAGSNDSEARALTLQVLASLAPVAKDHKQVHHLIIEELSSPNKFEFQSACHALSAYASLSTEFCDCVMGPLTEMLLSPTSDVFRKKELIPVLGEMRANLETTQAAFALGTRMLRGNMLHHELMSSMLNSLTKLAMATRFSIPDQLTLLLDVLCSCDTVSSLSLVSLHNIKKLAAHAHMWEPKHMQSLRNARVQCEKNNVVFGAYLNVFIEFTQHALPGHKPFFLELHSDLSSAYGIQDICVRVSFLRLSTNIFSMSPSDSHCSLLLAAYISTLPLTIPQKIAKRFYSCCSNFLSLPSVGGSLWEIVSLLTSLPLSHPNMSLIVDMVAQLVDTLPMVVAPFSQWVKKVYREGNFASLPVSTLAFILLSSDEKVTELHPTWMEDNERKYEVARVALRTGHWSDVAAPLFAAIDESVLSIESSTWITVLSLVASSQPREFTLEELQRGNDALREAEYQMKRLSNGSSSSTFLFSTRFISALFATSTLHTFIMRGLSDFLHMSEQFASKSTGVRVANLLQSALPYTELCILAWSWLSRTCFTADLRSLNLIEQMNCHVNIIDNGIQALTSVDVPASVRVPSLTVPCSTLTRQSTVLEWTNGEMEKIGKMSMMGTNRVNEQSINHFVVLLKSLIMQPVYLPRFFFQQMHHFDIRLSVSGPSELSALSTRPVPLQVDGVLSSTHPAKVIQVNITALIKFPLAPTNDFEQVQTVVPHDDKYFRAQFLIQFPQNAIVYFHIEFVDSERRICWKSEASATVKINVTD